MREQRVIAICLAAAALISVAWLVARADTVMPASTTSTNETPRPTPRDHHETGAETHDQPESSPAEQLVKKIRRQIGSPMEGSVFESASSGGQVVPVEFDEVYEGISRNAELKSESASVGELSQYGSLALDSQSADPQQRSQQSLRDAARQLEATAAELEDGGAYAEADDLRRWAKRLRAEAREIPQPNS